MKTKIFLAALSIVLGLSVVSCGNNKAKSATEETQQIIDSMTYAKNSKTTFTPPKKSFDEMSPQEVDELLDRLI